MVTLRQTRVLSPRFKVEVVCAGNEPCVCNCHRSAVAQRVLAAVAPIGRARRG